MAPWKSTTARRFIQETVISNPKITQEILMQKLAEAGHVKISDTTVAAFRTQVLGVLRILRDQGKLDIKL